MEIKILNKSFVAQGILEEIDSFIWTEKYQEHGDFEIYTQPTAKNISLLQPDYYVIIPESDGAMIIDTTGLLTDPESGNKLVVKGRSLESILDRRVFQGQMMFDGSLQDSIQSMLNSNVINASQSDRNIPGFIFSASSNPEITGLTLKDQYDGEELYETIRNLCVLANIGFKIILNSNNQFVFSLYVGTDRSYAQNTNTHVVFSPNFDNLIKSDFFKTKRYTKNYALIFGDSSDSIKPRAERSYPVIQSGLDRREMLLDASDVSKFVQGTWDYIDPNVYTEQLWARGEQELAQRTDLSFFNGQIDLNNSYRYKTDFFLGDLVQMVDFFGNSSRVQIIEMTFSENQSGYEIYPTLKSV